MAFPKPTPEAKAAFEAMLPMDARVTVRPMFGQLAAFVNGQMFMGIFGENVFLRLSEGDREAAFSQGATPFGPMPERPMKEYVTLPDDWLARPQAAGEWVNRSLSWTSSLPPKKESSKSKSKK